MISTGSFLPGIGFAALAAFLQLTLLPGILVLLLLRKQRTAPVGLSTALLTFTVSMVFTFQCLLLLHRLGLHVKAAWLTLALAEVLLWIWLVFRRAATPAPGNRLQATLALPSPWHPLALTGLAVWVIGIGLLGSVLATHWPGAFAEWDAVINWNRWALDWYEGNWPRLTWGYPQLLPASWSLFYVWQHSAETEVFIRAWLGLFPVATAVVFLDMYVHWRRVAPLIAGTVLLLLLLGPYAQVLDSGYVDLPVAFFILLTGHWVLLSKQYPDQPKWLLFAALAAAAALLTKQSGLLAAAILVVGCYESRHALRHVAAVALVLLASVFPWYLLQAIDGSGDNIAEYVTSGIYGTETLLQRWLRALGQDLPALVLPGKSGWVVAVSFSIAVMALACSCKDRRGRFCSGIGIVYLFIWASWFSYDERNLLPALPWLLLAIAIGIEVALGAFAQRLGLVAIAHIPDAQTSRVWAMPPVLRRAIPLFVLGVVSLAAFTSDAAYWEQLTAQARRNSGDPVLNEQLLDFVGRPGFEGKIYTTYAQLASISELRPHLYRDFGIGHSEPNARAAIQAGRPLCEILAAFPANATISHMLLHRSVYPAIIESALADGSLQLALETPDQRLMRVNCSNRGTPAP